MWRRCSRLICMDARMFVHVSTLMFVQGIYSFSLFDAFQIHYPWLILFRLYNLRLALVTTLALVLSPERAPVSSVELFVVLFFVTVHSKYLLAYISLILRFEAGVCITADFPINWPQCHRPGTKPFFEWFVFEGIYLPRRLPLETLRAEATTIFNFVVLSKFHSAHTFPLSSGAMVKVNPLPFVKSKSSAA